jgi:prepilin peptidase CpaA
VAYLVAMDTARLLGVAIAAAAAGADLRWRRVPKALTIGGLAAGLGWHLWAGGLPPALMAAAAGLLLGLPLLQLRVLGGGDVKLLAALGAVLGWHLWLWSVEFGLLAAGAWALAQTAARRQLPFLPARVAAIAAGWRDHGLQPHPDLNLDAPGATAIPFAAALCLGVLMALLWA